ncbi:MAG: hypothetical protein GX946_07490 [Oligosphaeraceae bacterium]|nr:hypothetical protein [Oligosphaeraceae bacterium]
MKDFQKTDAQVTGFEGPFLFLRNFFELFDFSVMGEGNRLHAGAPPALHIASGAIA